MSATATSSSRSRQREYAPKMRQDLQGMRAFAVLTVFADHLFGWPSGGFVGVDVFFVLSGFFITGLLLSERVHTGGISFKNFYVRRVRRIVPSAVLVIVVTVLVSHLLLTQTRAKEALIDGLWASVFLSNWRFERVGTDYFAQSQPDSPLLHYWSLSIEEQFYLVWPLLLLGLFAVTRRYSKPGRRYPVTRQLWLAAWLVAICASSFVWAVAQNSLNPTAAYFSTFTRIWELGFGALLAVAAPQLGRIPDSLRLPLSYLGFTGAVVSLFVISPSMSFPAPWAALPVVSTALVITAFVGGQVHAVPHLTNPVAQYFGEVSYTLYLWHWPVVILLAAVLPPGLTYSLAVVIGALVLTAVTYHFYEGPIRRSNWLADAPPGDRLHWLNVSPQAWAAVGALGLACVLVAATSLEVGEQRSATAQENQTLNVTAEAPILNEENRCFGAAALTTAGCLLYDPTKPVLPSLDSLTVDGAGAYECYRKQGEPFESCSYGYKGPDAKHIAMVGNSHAAMFLTTFSEYLIENKWNLTTFVGYGCIWQASAEGDCTDMQSRTQEQILKGKFDLVMTSSSRQHGNPAQAARYVETWRPVAQNGSKILVLADVPTVSPEALACVTRVNSELGDCSTPRDIALAIPDQLPIAAQQVPGATVLDMTDSFCVGGKCPAVIGNVIVYMDANSHITATYGRTLATRVTATIKQILGQ